MTTDDKRVNIRLIGSAAPGQVPFPGVVWLVSYDPEAHEGQGHVVASPVRSDAMVLADAAAAMQLYQRVPTCHPIRKPDGKPNRPLTAYHIEIVRVGVKP